MKYFITLFFFLSSFSDNAVGQMKISDLIKLAGLNESDAEAYLNGKGCQIEDAQTGSLFTEFRFFHSNPRFWVGITQFPEGCKIVYCDFSNTTFYNEQKVEAEKLGFRYKKKEIYEKSKTADGETYKSIFYIFEKSGDTITFITQIFSGRIQYEIAYDHRCPQ